MHSAGVFIRRANGFNRESAVLKLPKTGENGASQGERGGGGEKEEKASFSSIFSERIAGKRGFC